MKKRAFGLYWVALKILLKKDGRFLFLRTDDGRFWDLPGGRIDNVEARVPLEKVLAREVREELGKSLKYKLVKPVMHFRRYSLSKNMCIFVVVFEADYVFGEIRLSFEHNSYEWIDPKMHNLKKKDFMGKEEWLSFQNYFCNLK